MPSRFWGWSDVSLNDAVEVANRRVVVMAERIEKRELDRKAYSYGELPMREPILDEWKNAAGETWAMVTVNKYGCQVLNTAAIMFVDVDLPETRMRLQTPDWLRRLFGKKPPLSREPPPAVIMDNLRSVFARNATLSMRVYRTCSGLRCLMTQLRADPKAEATVERMRAFGADPLYVALCMRQECFRARLTPKPWRCGMRPLRFCYPWDESNMPRARMWYDEYARKTSDFATCALIEQLGGPSMDDEIARVVEFHDRATRVGSKLELA